LAHSILEVLEGLGVLEVLVGKYNQYSSNLDFALEFGSS
jgi:hypothetical protein